MCECVNFKIRESIEFGSNLFAMFAIENQDIGYNYFYMSPHPSLKADLHCSS